MRVEFINPFLDAMVGLLSTMGKDDAHPGKPFLKKDSVSKGDVTGLIGLTGGPVKGSLAISFSEATIIEITSNMLGETITQLDSTATDMVGEITNMVCGGAKRTLSEMGYEFDLAIPGTISGKGHTINHHTKGQTIILPFTITSGDFFVEICFEDQ